jgi:hypothetical protein
VPGKPEDTASLARSAASRQSNSLAIIVMPLASKFMTISPGRLQRCAIIEKKPRRLRAILRA